MLQNRFVIVLLFLLTTIGHDSFAQTKKVSSFGFDASDATTTVQKALLSVYDTLIIDRQHTAWTVGPLRFSNVKNKIIIFEEGVIFQAKKGSFPKRTDALITFRDSEHISIIGNGAFLQMNKEEYIDGEWRHGISLKNCSNIYIEDLTICGSGGDGLYLDGTSKGNYSENITIVDVISKNNKRQGMSIISAKNVTVKNSIFQDTGGTLPGAGLDLEPDHQENRLENIEFQKCTFKNNDHAGIVLALRKLDFDSRPISVRFIDCIIENNHSDMNKYIASEIVLGSNRKSPVKGDVLFENCLVQNSKWGLFYSGKGSDSYKVTFKDCIAKNICLDESYPAMYLEVPDYYEGSFDLGGFYFENVFFDYQIDVPLFLVRGSRLGTLAQISHISGNLILTDNTPEKIEYIKYDPENNKNFDLHIVRQDK